jgi:hypothetical protein
MQQHAQGSLEAARAAGDEQRVATAVAQMAEAVRLEAEIAAGAVTEAGAAAGEGLDEPESRPPA